VALFRRVDAPITRLEPVPDDDGAVVLVGFQEGTVAVDTAADLPRQEFDGEHKCAGRWRWGGRAGVQRLM